jgi:hypothetical protein
MTTVPSTHVAHSRNCETAEHPDCTCSCGGPGHQSEILKRCIACQGVGDPNRASLDSDLTGILGRFQAGFSSGTYIRRGRNTKAFVPALSSAKMTTGLGASRYETLVLDELLHDVLLRTADDPSTARLAPLVEALTSDCVGAMTTAVKSAGGIGKGVAKAHIWCTLLTVQLEACRTGMPATLTTVHSGIAYPRQSAPTFPSLLNGPRSVEHIGLKLIADAVAIRSGGLSPAEVDSALSLVAITCCPDMWRHPWCELCGRSCALAKAWQLVTPTRRCSNGATPLRQLWVVEHRTGQVDRAACAIRSP